MTNPVLTRLCWRCAWLPWLAAATLAHSQTLCSSNEQPTPSLLFERFISAECDTCWRDPATPVAPPGALVLDWVVPSDRGDDAALSVAASGDALQRLNSLQRTPSRAQDLLETTVSGWPGASLQVARGLALGAYVGASIDLTLPADTPLALLSAKPLSAWLVLVEALPVGLEGSPIARHLVRNVLQLAWGKADALARAGRIEFSELRPMNIPQGAQPERLRVIGWVQDASGRVLSAAMSVCPAAEKDG